MLLKILCQLHIVLCSLQWSFIYNAGPKCRVAACIDTHIAILLSFGSQLFVLGIYILQNLASLLAANFMPQPKLCSEKLTLPHVLLALWPNKILVNLFKIVDWFVNKQNIPLTKSSSHLVLEWTNWSLFSWYCAKKSTEQLDRRHLDLLGNSLVDWIPWLPYTAGMHLIVILFFGVFWNLSQLHPWTLSPVLWVFQYYTQEKVYCFLALSILLSESNIFIIFFSDIFYGRQSLDIWCAASASGPILHLLISHMYNTFFFVNEKCHFHFISFFLYTSSNHIPVFMNVKKGLIYEQYLNIRSAYLPLVPVCT